MIVEEGVRKSVLSIQKHVLIKDTMLQKHALRRIAHVLHNASIGKVVQEVVEIAKAILSIPIYRYKGQSDYYRGCILPIKSLPG